MKYGLIPDLSNADYHESNGFLSSSMIKLILQSPELYYQKYIKKSTKKEENDAFDVGTAIHARILEPEEYNKTVTFFSGIKRGKIWDEFKKQQEGKIILGDLQKMQLDRMYESFIKSDLGPKLISGGQSEISLFTKLGGFDVKVRADYLNKESGQIFDLKSTAGMLSEEKFKYNLESKLYGYDLQAALYADAYSSVLNRPFEFLWIVMSKDFDDIKFFRASPELIAQGREKYKKALKIIQDYSEKNWEFDNGIIELYPSNSFNFEGF